MICVYPADCTDFSTNGSGTLAPMSAEVTETLNGEKEIEISGANRFDTFTKTRGGSRAVIIRDGIDPISPVALTGVFFVCGENNRCGLEGKPLPSL